MSFVAGAISAGLINTATELSQAGDLGSVWPFGRRSAVALASIYGLRMAAVFTLSTTTLAMRLHLVPRWLAILGYLTAAVLLVGADSIRLVGAGVPAWISVLSIHILVVAYRRGTRVGLAASA